MSIPHWPPHSTPLQQNKQEEQKKQLGITKNLYYCETHQKTVIRYYASQMQLVIHSGRLYLCNKCSKCVIQVIITSAMSMMKIYKWINYWIVFNHQACNDISRQSITYFKFLLSIIDNPPQPHSWGTGTQVTHILANENQQ